MRPTPVRIVARRSPPELLGAVLRSPVFPAVALLVVLAARLAMPGSCPPGLWRDEAALGYNAWALAHYGVDEYGYRYPLQLRSFGDFKSPLYAYLLAPLTRFLPLTPLVTRLPAILCGLLTCALMGLMATRIARSAFVGWLIFLVAGVTPWLVLPSRVALEVNTLLVLVALALYLVSHDSPGTGTFVAVGLCLGAALFAYPTARLGVPLVLVAMLGAYQHSPRTRYRVWWTVLPVLVLGMVQTAANLHQPQVMLVRFATVSLAFDSPPGLTLVERLVENYASYLGWPFLFKTGDSNPLNHTGFGGMLYLTMLPLLLAGLAACWQRRHEPLPRFALSGLALAPLPAALTAEGTPHALRSALMVPFFFLIMAYGAQDLKGLLSRHRAWAALWLVLAVIETTGYLRDLMVYYPARDIRMFDLGQPEGLREARRLSPGNSFWVSDRLSYIHALYEVKPSPLRYAAEGTKILGFQQKPLTDIARLARPGELMLLAGAEQPPAGSTAVWSYRVPLRRPLVDVHHTRPAYAVPVVLYRR